MARQRYLENKALAKSFGVDGSNHVFSSQERSHLFSHAPRKSAAAKLVADDNNKAIINTHTKHHHIIPD